MAERESSLEKRERQDKEKADYIKDRQIRLGHVEAPKPKPKPKASSKESE
jgi:hypothetical protein